MEIRKASMASLGKIADQPGLPVTPLAKVCHCPGKLDIEHDLVGHISGASMSTYV